MTTKHHTTSQMPRGYRTLEDIAEHEIALFGGKSAGLARLAKAGLEIPTGIAITEDAATERLLDVVPIAHSYSVRSSASIEDVAGKTLAGMFYSAVDVSSSRLHAEVARVRASKHKASVEFTAQRLGLDTHDLNMATIIHPYVHGTCGRCRCSERSIVVETDDWFFSSNASEHAGACPWDEQTRASAIAFFQEVYTRLDKQTIDLEWVFDGSFHLLQMREVTVTRASRKRELATAAYKVLGSGRYVLDSHHYPNAVCLLQQSLIEMADTASDPDYGFVSGFVYRKQKSQIPISDSEEQTINFASHYEPLFAKMLSAWRQDFARLTIQEHLERFLTFVSVYGDSSKHLKAETETRAGLASVMLRQIAKNADRFLDDYGDISLSWDIISPPLRQTPKFTRLLLERAQEFQLGHSETPSFERDNLWFARAQGLMRRAVIAFGYDNGIGEDIFHISARHWHCLPDRAQISHNKLSYLKRQQQSAAQLVVDGVPQTMQPRKTFLGSGGFGPRIVGRAILWQPETVAPPGSIVIAHSLSPTAGPFVCQARGIVTERATTLDHAMVLANDFGLSCVVGCAYVTGAVGEGDLLTLEPDKYRVSIASAAD